MAIQIDNRLRAETLRPKLSRLFELAAEKTLSIERTWDSAKGTPVFTVKGRYTSRGWTEWTQGFQVGAALLIFDATGERPLLELGRTNTRRRMAPHLTHIGVHDHGFNNISTYGALWRLAREGKFEASAPEIELYELALKVSGAVQAARWTDLGNGKGYIYSFNGPHSLFVDTQRSLRALAVGHQLGHVLMGERDRRISLLDRLAAHGRATAEYSIYYGGGRDAYDISGRTAHESIFNLNDGSYRCPNSQQGYSPFSTWTRGLAWAMLGFAEQLEYLDTLSAPELASIGGEELVAIFTRAAVATSDFYLEEACACGVPMWDSGAPQLHRLGEYRARAADPFNRWEPVDSSAAAIAAQALIRLGQRPGLKRARQYRAAGLTAAATLLDEPYLSTSPKHQGLLLHSVYHRPNGWDYVARGQQVPNGESSMWGDYHLMELALLLWKERQGEPYLTFFAPLPFKPT